MKHLLYSDCHWRSERLEDLEHVHREILEIFKARSIDGFLVNLGDTFHTRGVIPTECFHSLYQAYRSFLEAGISQIILIGNHDQKDRDGKIHPLKVFESFHGWKVVDEPTFVPQLGWCFPYSKDVDLYLSKVRTTHPAFVHAGFKGAYMNSSFMNEDGVSLDTCSSFKRVFSGHYHLRQTLENVTYVGSPLQQNFGEMGQDKGVLIYDASNDDVEFVEITGTPKHYEVAVSWENGKRVVTSPSNITERDFVRIKAVGSSEEVSAFTSEETDVLCRDKKIERIVVEDSKSRLAVDDQNLGDLSQLLHSYIEHVDPQLDHQLLFRIGDEAHRNNLDLDKVSTSQCFT